MASPGPMRGAKKTAPQNGRAAEKKPARPMHVVNVIEDLRRVRAKERERC
jgi:hypothetical protein